MKGTQTKPTNIPKKVKKVLDKLFRVCYNKSVKKGKKRTFPHSKERNFIMTTENTTPKAPRVTKASAVRSMLDAAIANGYDNAEAIEVVEGIYKQLTAKRTPTGPTKKQKENAALMEQVTNAMRGSEPMTLSEITEKFGLPSWQKASALMKAGVAAGIVTVNTEGKKNTYVVA